MQPRIAVPLAVLAALLGAALTGCGGGKSATPTSTQTAGSSPSATREASPSAVAATATSAPPSPADTEPAIAPQPTANSVPPTDVPPPPPPVATSTPVPPPPPPPPPAETRLSLVAQDTRFVPVSLSAPAGAITIVLDNRDAGTAHNINVFSGNTSIASTAPAAGPVTESLSLGTLTPGTYTFVCDVHPQAMHGVLTVG